MFFWGGSAINTFVIGCLAFKAKTRTAFASKWLFGIQAEPTIDRHTLAMLIFSELLYSFFLLSKLSAVLCFLCGWEFGLVGTDVC